MRAFAFLAVILLTASLAFAQTVFHPAEEVKAGAFGALVGGGNYTFNNSMFVVDKLGIGTTNPVATLDVQGAAQFGSGDVNLIDSSGKIAGISSTYFASLNGAALTDLAAGNIATGNLNIARMPTSGNWAPTGNLTIDTSTLAVDVTNDRVGVGTPTPTSVLHVASATETYLAKFGETGVANRLVILRNGSVGIGTNTPGFPLEINSAYNINGAGYPSLLVTGSSNKERIHVRASGAGTTAVMALFTTNAGTEAVPLNTTSGTGLGSYQLGGYESSLATPWTRAAWMAGSATENWNSTGHGADIYFSTTPNGSTTIAERVRITSEGWLGIGTATPNNYVTVDRKWDGSTTLEIRNTADLGNTNARAHLLLQSNDSAGELGAYPSDYGTAVFRDSFVMQANTAASAGLILRSGAGSSSIQLMANGATTPQLIVNGSTGYVGIGTPTPGAKLDVAGHTRTASLSIQGTTGATAEAGSIFSNSNWGMLFAAKQASPALGQFVWLDSTLGTEYMRIGASGGLTVTQGPILITTSDQSITRLKLANTGSGGQTFEIVGGDVGVSNSGLSFYDTTNSATRLRIDSAGKVGIGTTSPDSKLHVIGGACIEASDSGCAQSAGNLQASTITATTQFSGPGTGLTGTASSLNIGGSAGSAGSATYGRYVYDNGAYSGVAQWRESSAMYTYRASLADSATNIAGGSAGAIPFQTGGSTTGFDAANLFWDNTNKLLGIGTASTNGKLTILSGNNVLAGSFYAGTGVAGQSFGVYMAAGTNAADYALQINNRGGSNLLYVRGDGNVGIGTASPKAKLQIGDVGTIFRSGSGATEQVRIGRNVYNDGSFKRLVADNDALLVQLSNDGEFQIYMEQDAGNTADSVIDYSAPPAFRVANNGNVGIGVVVGTTPAAPLHVVGTNGIVLETASNSGFGVYLKVIHTASSTTSCDTTCGASGSSVCVAATSDDTGAGYPCSHTGTYARNCLCASGY